MHLARDLNVYPIGDGLLLLSWAIGVLWSGVHLGIVR